MSGRTEEKLAFCDAEVALRRREGCMVRVEVNHRSSPADLAGVPQSLLQSVEPIPEEVMGFAGNGLRPRLGDRHEEVIFVLLVHEQLFDYAIEFDFSYSSGSTTSR